MYEVMVENSFAAAHRLLNYNGACEKQHGHNWKVQVFARGESLDKSGILIDYKIIFDALDEIIEKLDHTDINSLEAFKDAGASSELIARYIYKELKRSIPQLHRVSVWETDRTRATYWE